MAIVGLVFEERLVLSTQVVVGRIVFVGLCAIVLINDVLVTPLPGDLLLVEIAKSELAREWLRHVLNLGLATVLAGLLGWGNSPWSAV